MRREILCPCCDSQFTIEFDDITHPAGPEVCPFCDNALFSENERLAVDTMMDDT